MQLLSLQPNGRKYSSEKTANAGIFPTVNLK